MTRRGFIGRAAGSAVAGAGLAVPATPDAGLAVPTPGPAPGATRAAPQFASRTLDAPPAAGAWVELHRGAVVANLAAIRERAGGRPVMGVIKADGYGHGIVPMAGLLADAGVDALLVITVDEAVALRDAGITTPVLNYGPFDPDAAEELIARDIDQAVYTVEAVDTMADAARRLGMTARLQLVLDTGLGRVGAARGRAQPVVDAIAAADGAGAVCTGLATALSEDPEFDRVQLERYLAVHQVIGRRLDVGARHVAASAAVLDFPESHLDMVRPGIMLYGHYPNDRSRAARPVELQPVLSLRARVAYVKTLQPGDSIGYHRAYVAEREETVATLPIGHSEGYPAAAVGGGGHVEIEGRACALVGEATSNHIEVRIPEGLDVEIGDIATLIAGGANVMPGGQSDIPPSAPRVSDWSGVGVYGLLMHINPLLPRVVT